MNSRNQSLDVLQKGRTALLLTCTGLVLLAYAAGHPLIDFAVYWTAAHLFVAHRNAYSFVEAFNIQRALGWNGPVPLMFLCPPWVLAIIAPLGYAKSYLLAWLAWVAILIIATAMSSRLLMDLYFGSTEIAGISHPHGYRYLFAFTFYPVLLALKFTQLAPLFLLGISGFVYFDKRNRHVVSGAFLFLTLLKPHLFMLIWLALLLKLQWKPLLSAIPLALLTSLIAIHQDHHVFREYWELMRGPFPTVVLSGILGGVRSSLGPQNTYWLQYAPPMSGLLWFYFYWRIHGRDWNWAERIPALITASLVSAPYGFTYDQTLLIIPVIYLAASSARDFGRLPSKLVVIYTAMNVTVLAVAIVSTPWAVVPAPVFIAIYLAAKRSRLVGTKTITCAAPVA